MEIERLQKIVRPILDEYGISRASLFGSVVHGDEDPESDIDIAVEIESEEFSLLDFVELKQKLEDELARPVDLVEYSEIKPRVKEDIRDEQVGFFVS